MTTDSHAPPADAADRLLAKLRRLAAELDPEERVLLGVWLAPLVAQATEGEDVEGFAFSKVGDAALADRLHDAIRRSGVRLVDLGEPSSGS